MSLPAFVPCFWIEEIGQARRMFRRYRSSIAEPVSVCDARYGYHNAHAPLDISEVPIEATMTSTSPNEFKDDPRWPVKCDHCDYVFQPDDNYQIFQERLYRRTDTGEVVDLRTVSPGAMWNAWWMADLDPERPGPDGKVLMIKLPGGHEWCPDRPSSNGTGRWQRTGDPTDPKTLTIRPSILFEGKPRFHAYLTDGKLDVLPDSEPWE
jgi:hypothetical protein